MSGHWGHLAVAVADGLLTAGATGNKTKVVTKVVTTKTSAVRTLDDEVHELRGSRR